MRWLLAGLLAILLIVLQYRLWLAEGGIAEAVRLRSRIEAEQMRNAELEARNSVLERQVIELQSGTRVLEKSAREDLGLIREGETYFQFKDDQDDQTQERPK